MLCIPGCVSRAQALQSLIQIPPPVVGGQWTAPIQKGLVPISVMQTPDLSTGPTSA